MRIIKRLFLFLVVVLFFSNVVLSQKPSKEFKMLFTDAYENMQKGKYAKSVTLFEEIERLKETNPNTDFNIGVCYLNIPGDKSRAIPYLEKAVLNVSENYKEGSYRELKAPKEAFFYLANAYRINMQLSEAIEFYGKYLENLSPSNVYHHDFVNLQVQTCKNAQEMITTPVPLVKTNLGDVINDEDDNFNPVITSDGQVLIYSTLQRVFDQVTQKQKYYSVIKYTTREGEGWKEPIDITSKINSDGNLSTVGISSDGMKMYFFRDDNRDGNLYVSEKKESDFLDIEELYQINSKDWESHICPVQGKDAFYFVSNRSGGQGGRDIYYIERTQNGKWSNPQNLGNTINTPYDEDCPVISQDGNTLYFCSQAHNSIGGFDIFYSTKNTSGQWSAPLNVGYPINSTDDDLFLMPYDNGKNALIALRDNDTYGGLDIYSIQLNLGDNNVIETKNSKLFETDDVSSTVSPEKNKIDSKFESFDVRGIVLLQDSKKLSSAFRVEVRNSLTQSLEGSASLSAEGLYSINVKPGNYIVTFSGPGYETLQRTVGIPADYGLPKVTVDVELVPQPVAQGEYMIMRGVLFELNSALLSQNAKIKLEKLLSVMTQNSHLFVEVSGFSASSENPILSSQRADNVIAYLENHGIEKSRFVAKAMGHQKPLAAANNINPEAQKYNRRVEINILKSGNTKIIYEEFRVPESLSRGGGKRGVEKYTILLVESKVSLSPSKFSEVERQGVSNVWIFPSSGGYFYTIGKFVSRADASKLLNGAVDMGFPNASIINFRELEKRKYRGFVESKRRIALEKQQNGKYTIQLLALKVPVETTYFKNLEGVERIRGKDGLYRYIWGRFDYKTAVKKRLELRENGYNGAFVMNMEFFD